MILFVLIRNISKNVIYENICNLNNIKFIAQKRLYHFNSKGKTLFEINQTRRYLVCIKFKSTHEKNQ